MPVLMLFSPVPSSESFNSIFVSAVCLDTVLARFVVIYGEAFLARDSPSLMRRVGIGTFRSAVRLIRPSFVRPAHAFR